MKKHRMKASSFTLAIALTACGASVQGPTSDAGADASADATSDAATDTVSDTTSESGGDPCGGFAGAMCKPGFWCAYLDGMCHAPDAGGTCRKLEALPCVPPNPDGSDDVCGCDGVTYHSSCEATSSGMSIDHTGACTSTGKTCGGIVGASCAATEYCDWLALPSDCGGADGAGTCKPRPASCVPQDGIWCGCDGKTYESECAAAKAGFGVRKNGPCP